MHHNRPTYQLNSRPAELAGLLVLLCFFPGAVLWAQVPEISKKDSIKRLEKVTVTGEKKPNPYSSIVPVQLLNREALQQINAESIAGAAKYFSGVLIKDYGGVGGLKTISVRSLGGMHTGLVYDGIPIADAQSGQVDLSKFSATFVQSLQLDQSAPQQIPLPARVYASASVLSFTSNTFNTTEFSRTKWLAGLNTGSFGLWQPYGGFYLPVSKNCVISANAEATWAKGDYPYTVSNGVFSGKKNRSNADLQSFQGEFNVVYRFADSSVLQTKGWAYQSERGLPGSIIYFNEQSSQRLDDKNYFAQARYLKKISPFTTLLLSGKYSYLYTRYQDPSFPNNTGGLDNRYTQTEGYGSVSLSHVMGKHFAFSIASDIASTHLSANINHFPTPTRMNWWNNLTLQFHSLQWQIHAGILNTNMHDQTVNGPAMSGKNEFNPSVAIGFKPTQQSPFLVRFFYKNIFRMPTFNDLYYTYNMNINPDLKPEYTNQYDGGITYTRNISSRLNRVSFSVDAYFNQIRDKILAVPSQNLFVWTMKNIGEVQSTGIDINAEAAGDFSSRLKWSFRAAYSWQRALDVSDASSPAYKDQIPYTPENSGSALAGFYFKNWSAGCSILFSGKRYTLGENNPSNTLPGWNTEDLFVSWKKTGKYFQTTLKGELNNVFDQQYDVIRFYPMPGRSYKISIIFQNL